MKCQYIRDDMEVSPAYVDLPEYADAIEYRDIMRNGQIQSVPFFKNGAIIDHPNAYWEVMQGTAIPADEVCRQRAFMNAEQMQAAQYAYERTVRGIEPQDYDKYDKGQILGYNPDGSYIPGPNFADLEAELVAMSEVQEEDDV